MGVAWDRIQIDPEGRGIGSKEKYYYYLRMRIGLRAQKWEEPGLHVHPAVWDNVISRNFER